MMAVFFLGIGAAALTGVGLSASIYPGGQGEGGHMCFPDRPEGAGRGARAQTGERWVVAENASRLKLRGDGREPATEKATRACPIQALPTA